MKILAQTPAREKYARIWIQNPHEVPLLHATPNLGSCLSLANTHNAGKSSCCG